MGEAETAARPVRRRTAIGAVALVAVLLAAIALLGRGFLLAPAGARTTPSPGVSSIADGPTSSPSTATLGPTSAPTTSPTAAPPSMVDVPAPLTGILVDPLAALRHPIAVMVDDQAGARPQSGFNAAAVVIQAPAEGGIPRYMMIFQNQIPGSVGPVRSARQYFIEWAAGWNAMYVHHGGSPQALATLQVDGRGQLVWNADGFRWSPTYLWRISQRPSPHNVYTDGLHLRALARRIDVPDDPIPTTWTFEPQPVADTYSGNVITVVYPNEAITFRYDATRNIYLRYINGSAKPQVDAADGQLVTPTNVVVIRMHFGPLLNSNPAKHRLEAADVGRGDAWISTGGRTIHGYWTKTSVGAPLLFFDGSGHPAALQPGQTFIEVLALNYPYSIRNGTPVQLPDRTLSGTQIPT